MGVLLVKVSIAYVSAGVTVLLLVVGLVFGFRAGWLTSLTLLGVSLIGLGLVRQVER